MAKSSIRKTDPTDTTAPAKRRRAAATETTEGAPVKASRPRRKTDAVVPTVATTVATLAVEHGTNGHDEFTFEVPHEQIAVRAYHIFLERGYAGDSFNDWVTAERELREQYARTRSQA